MQRTLSMSMGSSPFRSATGRLVLANGIVFAALWVLDLVYRRGVTTLFEWLQLEPVQLFHGQVWRLVTSSFLNTDLLSTIFGLMALWSIGALLEQSRGTKWMLELYFCSMAGGALIASMLFTTHIFGPSVVDYGIWGGICGLTAAVAIQFAETPFIFFFVIPMKAKYIGVFFLVLELARLASPEYRFDAAVNLASMLAASLFVLLSPRGVAFEFSEGYYGLRNSYYRWKRKRAAKKFTVYMRKQNRDDVHFDAEGHYVDPDKDPRDSNGKPWVN